MHKEFFAAADTGRLALLERFRPTDIDVLDDEGASAMMHAVQVNDLLVVKQLLQWGANPTSRRRDGISMLHIAAWKDNRYALAGPVESSKPSTTTAAAAAAARRSP